MTNLSFTIIHGTMGSPSRHWFQWLKSKLESLGAKVTIPSFPTPDQQKLDIWRSTFQREVGDLTANSVLIGHSIGAGFALRLVEEAKVEISGTFLIAGFCRLLNNPEFDPYLESFVAQPFNWNLIRKNSKFFNVYNGDNDPYVPLELGLELAENLGATCSVIKQGGHLNESAGYTEFPKLLSDIRSSLSI